MAYQTILIDKQDGVGVITMNRPEKLNALNLTLQEETDQALIQFENDDDVKAIVVTGAGNKAFSAGGDIHEMSQQSKTQLKERAEKRRERLWHLAVCKKPTIGAINGLAFGGASVLSSLFDIRIGCEKTRFRFLMVVYGRAGATWTLPFIVGWPMAKELLLTGRLIEAEEALRIGLLNKLVPSESLMDAAMEMGRMMATNNAESVRAIKQMMIEGIGMSWRDMMLNESKIRAASIQSSAPKETFKDFLERKEK